MSSTYGDADIEPEDDPNRAAVETLAESDSKLGRLCRMILGDAREQRGDQS